MGHGARSEHGASAADGRLSMAQTIAILALGERCIIRELSFRPSGRYGFRARSRSFSLRVCAMGGSHSTARAPALAFRNWQRALCVPGLIKLASVRAKAAH